MEQSPSSEASSHSARQEIPVFTRACHWSLSRARWYTHTERLSLCFFYRITTPWRRTGGVEV